MTCLLGIIEQDVEEQTMPRQEIFFEQQDGKIRVEVVKIYDQSYAREVFTSMNEFAQVHLWATLKPEDIYEPADLPKLDDVNGEGGAFLWDELLDRLARTAR